MMKRKTLKLFAVAAAMCLSAGMLLHQDNLSVFNQKAEAKTMEEIETEKKQKQQEIEAKRAELETLDQNIQNEAEYQQTLQEEIDLINNKMLLIDTQLQSLNADIAAKEQEISDLETKIDDQNAAIEEGLETFKARIRSLYINGNDGLLSVLVGATDFYDVLSRMDIMKRIAKHDDDLVNGLKSQLEEYHSNQQDLQSRIQALNLKQTETEAVKKEFADSRAELDAAMEKSSYMQQELALQKEQAEGTISENEQALQQLQAEEEQLILEQIKKEEEERLRKQKEEEERKRQEELAKQQLAQQQQQQQQQKPQQKPQSSSQESESDTSTSTVTTPATYQGGSLAWPVPGYYHISSGFGARWGRNHNGIDISGPGIQGKNACAAGAGTVITVRGGCTHNTRSFCGCNGGWGNYVVINHGNGLYTLYAHMQSLSVSVGQKVTAGTVVGHIGMTGNVTGPHLHFCVMVGGTGNYVNPTKYLY